MKIWLQLNLITYFMLMLIGSGCSYKGKLASQNLAVLYKPDQQLSGLSYAVINLNDSATMLYYRLPLSNLKYTKGADGIEKASYKLDYQIYDGYKKGMLTDSGSHYGIDSVMYSGILEDSLQVKAFTGKNYIIQVNFSDLNAKSSIPHLINLPKSVNDLSSDYLLTDEFNKPLMRNYINRAEKVRIRSRFPVDSVLELKRYDFSSRTAALSPFNFSGEDKSYEPELMNNIAINFHNVQSEPFKLNEEGIFVFGKSGFRFKIFRFYDGFPKIGSAGVMRESLRYISTDEEYREMMLLPPKAAVDKFWINITGNPERALSQIKRYYSRVEAANELFTLSGEGWMSDRGMVYIVFGPPNIVYRNADVEEWTFGEAGNALSVRFYFHPFRNSLGIEDYKLARSEDYRRPWHLAVSNWRR